MVLVLEEEPGGYGCCYAQTVLDYMNNLKEFLEESSIFRQRAFQVFFVESIEAGDSQITLTYALLLPWVTLARNQSRL